MPKLLAFDGKNITIGCTQCGHEEKVDAKEDRLNRLLYGDELIQNILYDVPADIREMFISGWCGCCYDLNLMYFPAKAMKELTNYSRKVMGDNDIELITNDDVVQMLSGYEEDAKEVPEIADRIEKIRKKINEIADKIDRGEYDDDSE